jgi:hypothetical protein
MKKFFLFFFSLSFLSLLLIKPVLAVCPVCAVAVGAGIGFTQWLGIDDVITGLWVGALTVSLIMWTISWLKKKNINFKGRDIITVLLYYSLIVVPLYFLDFIGNPLNVLCGCPVFDKLIVGIIVGSFAFWFSANWYEDLKKNNNNHAHFPFQRVVMPIVLLLILSIFFYFLIK